MIPQINTVTLQNIYGGALRPGQAFQTVVQMQGDKLLLQLGAARIALDPSVELTPGETVRVEVLGTAAKLQLRISPAAAAPETAAGTVIPNTLLTSVLESLGALPIADVAPTLIPAHLPQTTQVLQQLFTLFLSRGSLGADVEQLATLLAQASSQGALSGDLATRFGAWVTQFTAMETTGFKNLLEQLSSKRSLEARLALALKTNSIDASLESLSKDIRTQLAQLREQEPLRAWLRENGQLRQFDDAVQRVLNRFSGGELQNLRALEQPYLFLEIPLPSGSELRFAQVHFFGEGRNKGKPFDQHNALVALDLNTTRLGDLWITLQMTAGRCACHFKATTSEIVQAIRDASDELVDSLDKAGYLKAHITVSRWDGDRIRAAAAMMRRFSGIDVKL
ncbi:MAG TPA: flagellar hook-length control protein FliK [Candidatus Hydrogenedentes bacterium]|nr:flagellar hook-length control protein FliK [Candidatus Hydrogenedentota bacterium]